MIDKELFLKARIPERVVDIPDVGEVRLRGLTRAEAKRVQELLQPESKEDADAVMLSLCMVQPEISPSEAAAWLEEASLQEASLLLAACLDLSGLTEEAAKKTYEQFRDNGLSSRVLPSGEAGHDSGSAIAGNQ